MDAEEPEEAVDQHQPDDPAEGVRGPDEGRDRSLEEGDEVEAGEVDDEEDAAEHEGRGKEGDEAPDDDLRGAAGEAERPAPLDEDAGELDAGDGEEEAGEDAARAEPGEHEGGGLRGGPGLEGGDDVTGGGDEAGAGGVELVGPRERLRGAEGDPQGDAAAEGAVGEEERRRVGRDEAL